MAKVFLFGSANIFSVPDVVVSQLEDLVARYPDVEFIVGDRNGAEQAFHKALSSVGARSKSTVVTLDKVSANKFDLKTLEFASAYLPDEHKAVIYKKDNEEVFKEIEGIEKVEDVTYDRGYYEFLDRLMIDMCDIAICLWDGESRGVFHSIQLMNIKGKNCYTFKINV